VRMASALKVLHDYAVTALVSVLLPQHQWLAT
jgi:hypothetical protein